LPLHPRRDLKARRRLQRHSRQRILQSNNVPAEIVAKLNQEVNSSLADAEYEGTVYQPRRLYRVRASPGDFGKLIADYTKKVGQDHPGG
jgi:hypothetical protein